MFDYEAVVCPREPGFSLRVAPGAYELTCGSKGAYVGANAVRVAAGVVVEVDLAADRRPRVEVVVPDLEPAADWWLSCARSIPGGMVAKWMAQSTRGGSMRKRELVAEVTPNAAQPHAFAACAPTSGRYTLTLGHKQLGFRLFREVALEFGQTNRIVVPALEGNLRADMGKYPEIWEHGAQHGIAGPRLCLEPLAGASFGVLVALPEPAQFTLQHLPVGSFALHHHLYETGMFPASTKGTWGGVHVTVATTTDTPVVALGRTKSEPTKVIVRDADGAAATGRLGVRDRMFDSWSAVVAENTTLAEAFDTLPPPPAVRMLDGAATLRLASGHVLFALENDDGSTVFFAREVEAGKDLEVRVPARR